MKGIFEVCYFFRHEKNQLFEKLKLSREDLAVYIFTFNSEKCAGFGGWEDVGSYRGCDISKGRASTSALTFSSRPSSSCSTQLPHIAETGNETLEAATCGRNLRDDNNGGNMKCYVPSFTGDFWDGSAFTDPKTASDNDDIMFSALDAFETQV